MSLTVLGDELRQVERAQTLDPEKLGREQCINEMVQLTSR